MSLTTRRNLLASAAAAAFAGTLSPLEAQHVHQQAAAAAKPGVPYKPLLFNDHDFKTVAHLADMIIPPEGAVPGGAGAGAPAYIDLLAAHNDELRHIWLGGLAWLDATMTGQCGKTFVDAPHEEHEKLLNQIAYRKNTTLALAPGIAFFSWARRMVVDAWVTSDAGTKALGYVGNVGMAEFVVPQPCIDYALARSPFKQV
jgi:hypothetical protein